MSKISKFVKVDKNVLLEYIYNDGNLISEAYDILVNSKDRTLSYMASESSATGNIIGNTLFKIDSATLKYGKIDSANYPFLQIKNYSAGSPIRHDVIRLHLPINWTFGEYLGLYIRVYTFDTEKIKTHDISNFYFDMTDTSQQYLMNFTSPPLLFQEKLWGKNIQIEVPAVSEISAQLTNTRPKENSLNANLTNGSGISSTSPIFVDFHFIDNIQTINAITTYRLTAKVTTSFSQSPEFERLGLMIRNSPNGDFFEIYGTYNDSLAGFAQFIDDSFTLGNRYYVQYSVTIYEQNIRGKTSTFTFTDNFNETIEYRPIIKTSTTTAIIDVEMKLIDSVDDSYIIRRASYGMLQDEVAKYSLKLMKINLSNATKPKVYSIKNAIDPSMIGLANSQGKMTKGGAGGAGAGLATSLTGGGIFGNLGLSSPTVGSSNNPPVSNQDGLISGFSIEPNVLAMGNNGLIQSVKVPFPVLIDKYNIIGKSENAIINSQIFYGLSKMTILIYPFDNIIKFNIATGDVSAPSYLDMTNLGEIKLVFKNNTDISEFTLYTETNEINLSVGQLVFRIPQTKFNLVKKIYDTNVNIFYITALNQNITTVVYTGLFKIFDNRQNVIDLNNQAAANTPSIIRDPSAQRETAQVTRQLINKPGARGTER
jgi:hypothetical protein